MNEIEKVVMALAEFSKELGEWSNKFDAKLREFDARLETFVAQIGPDYEKLKDNCRNLCEGPVPGDHDIADQPRTQELPDD